MINITENYILLNKPVYELMFLDLCLCDSARDAPKWKLIKVIL